MDRAKIQDSRLSFCVRSKDFLIRSFAGGFFTKFHWARSFSISFSSSITRADTGPIKKAYITECEDFRHEKSIFFFLFLQEVPRRCPLPRSRGSKRKRSGLGAYRSKFFRFRERRTRRKRNDQASRDRRASIAERPGNDSRR